MVGPPLMAEGIQEALRVEAEWRNCRGCEPGVCVLGRESRPVGEEATFFLATDSVTRKPHKRGEISVKVTPWEEEGRTQKFWFCCQKSILVGVGGMLEGSPGISN